MIKMRNIKIKYKLPALVVLLAVLPVMLVSLIAMRLNTDAALRTSEELMQNQTEAAAKYLEDFYNWQEYGLIYASSLKMYRDYLDALAGNLSRTPAELESLSGSIEDIQQVAINTDNRISNIMLLDRQGVIAVSPDHSLKGTEAEDPEVFRKAMEGYPDAYRVVLRQNGETVLIMAQPVRNDAGQALGVIMRQIDLTEVKEYVRGLKIGSSGYLFILNRAGQFLSYANEALPELMQESPELAALSQDIAARRYTSGSRRFSYLAGGERTEAYSLVDDATGWTVTAAMPQSEIYGHSRQVNRMTLMIAAGAGLLALFAGLLFAHQITAPLSELTENLNAIADGRMEHTAVCGGKDELGDVCEAANVMSHKLKLSYSRLEASAKTDILTGLTNRAGVYEIIGAKLTDRQQAAILLDLDGFKAVNDTYGHDSGDAVLISVARILQENASESVHPARLGGDEFFLFISHYDEEAEVAALGERLLRQISTIRTALGNPVSVSASIGIAFASPEEPGREALIKKADEAMYLVKNRGKSGVLIYGGAVRGEDHR